MPLFSDPHLPERLFNQADGIAYLFFVDHQWRGEPDNMFMRGFGNDSVFFHSQADIPS